MLHYGVDFLRGTRNVLRQLSQQIFWRRATPNVFKVSRIRFQEIRSRLSGAHTAVLRVGAGTELQEEGLCLQEAASL